MDLTGRVFGRLTVVGFSHKKRKHLYFDCLCRCGEQRKVRKDSLTRNLTKSCGCITEEKLKGKPGRHTTHGLGGTPTYQSWNQMRQRCDNPLNDRYHRYGGRGIKVCRRWYKFENFLADMEEKPKGLTIDRRDNDGNYSPKNCRWATIEAQNNNRCDNVNIVIHGIVYTVAKAARLFHMNEGTLRYRLKKGMEAHEAVFTS